MSKTRIYALLVSTATFFLGIVFQSLFDQWFPIKNTMSFVLIVIIVVLAILLLISVDILEMLNKRFKHVDTKLADIATNIANRTGLNIEYIEDDADGKSYKRSIELVEKATLGLTFVSPWNPLMEYQPDSSTELKSAKDRYYETIKKKISENIESNSVFHRRIIQIPKESQTTDLLFKYDLSFFEYLKYSSEAQQSHPRSCRLRGTSPIVNIHFTIIDERYVIIPITTFLKNGYVQRRGQIIFDDGRGELVKSLNFIYQTLDAYSRPIEPNQIIAQKPI